MTFVVAACQNDHGVTVTVHPNSAAVTKIRLYVGVGDSTTTDLTDDSMVTVTNAEYWTRDPGNEIDLLDVSKGSVTFNYDTSETIPVVIAIGYDDQGQPIAAGVADTLIPATGRNDFLIYDIMLVPADPFSQTSSPMQVGLWSPTTTDLLHASCAGIIDASKDHPYFVVLDNDQDCDGLLDGSAGECTPDIYHGTRGADPAKADCLFPTIVATNGLGGACQLGGSPCTDATPVTMESCQPSTTCLPTSLCGVCPPTHPKDFECAADLIASGVSVSAQAHYDCVVATDTSGNVCDHETLALDRPPTGGYDCTDFDIGDSRTALGSSIKQGNVTFSAHSLTTAASCAATIGVDGSPGNITQALSGFVNFTLKNTGGVAIPIVFTFNKSGCSLTAARCTLDIQTFNDPSQTRCAAGWQPATMLEVATSITEVADPSLTDDQKTIFYVSGGAIFTANKTATGWSTPMSLGLPTTDNRSPDVGGMGTTLVYTADAGVGRAIYIATRATVGVSFVQGVPLIDPSGTPSSFTAATFAPTNPQDAAGTEHVIAAGTIGGGSQQLYDVAYHSATSTIDSITPIMIANSPTSPDKPHLTPDGLQLYFEGTDQASVTLYVASRTTIDDAFTYAVELRELSTPNPGAYTGGAWVAPAGRTMYFTQQNAQGLRRTYVTTRANL